MPLYTSLEIKDILKKKISILFLIPTLDKGGAENVLVNLVNNMDYDKFDITVQTLFDKNSQKMKLNPKIEYKSFMIKQFRGNSRLFSLLPSRLLYKIIIKEKYDIVVSYLEGPTAHILSGCPYIDSKKVAWIHTAFDNRRGFRAGFRSVSKAIEAYQHYDKIAFVANMARERFSAVAGCEFPQSIVLYNTIESSRIEKLSHESISDMVFSNSSYNVISVGKIQQVKGYDRLARIHKRLLDNGVNVHINLIGIGEQQEEIEQYLYDNHLENSFSFLGFKDNPYKYVAKADLFVCSSRREGFSTAVTESLIVGTPVISTNCSGAYELLGENNEYGVVTDNNEDALYNGIKLLLDKPDLLAHYKEKAKERGEMFSTEKTVNAVEEMLQELCEDKKCKLGKR